MVEPSPGAFFFDLADDELAWARGLGFAMKGHTLLWGNAPPFSLGVDTAQRSANETVTGLFTPIIASSMAHSALNI